MEQVGGDVRVAFAVQQIHAQRAGMFGPGRVIGLLGELVDFHVISLLSRRRPVTALTLSSSAKADDPVGTDIVCSTVITGCPAFAGHDNVRGAHLSLANASTFSAKILGCS